MVQRLDMQLQRMFIEHNDRRLRLYFCIVMGWLYAAAKSIWRLSLNLSFDGECRAKIAT
jgi:hypothetical protein